ncbi:putative damage-inducible protein DinB [Mucilaginibacter sp. UYNi724]
MYTALLHQYQLVIYSREAVFQYLETLKPEDLLKPVTSFNNESIGSLFIHSADTYTSWLVNYARQEKRPLATEDNYQDMNAIRATFEQVNLIVNDFLHHFTDRLDKPMTLTKMEGMELTTSPLQLFTHVTTHEFHHKGQLMNMSRQLGYIPVDTDVIRS